MTPVSELLKKSVEIYRAHFGLLAGYMAWLLLPYAALIMFSLPKANPLLETLSTLCVLSQALLGLWLSVFLLLVIKEIAVGQKKIDLTGWQNKTWLLLPSVLFVALLETAVFLGGLVLLIVPAFIFWVWFAMAQLSVIFDGKKGMEAMAFSRELARGRFWPLVWRLAAGPAAIVLSMVVFSGLLIGLLAAATQTSFETMAGLTPPLWADAISVIVETFSVPLILIYSTLLYLDLTTVTNHESFRNHESTKIIE